MKTKILFLIVCCIGFSSLLQAQDDPYYDPLDEGYCIAEEITPFSTSRNSNSSTYGGAFTPDGELRSLVIFVDFEGADPNLNPLSGWPVGELPDAVDPVTGRISFTQQNVNDFSSLSNPAPDANLNLSEFFFHMSNGEFKFVFDTLKDDNGVPTLVTIDVDNVESYFSLNQITFQKIRELFPNRNWREVGFDNRINSPGFGQDTSTVFSSPNPDGDLDYIVVVYRDDRRWDEHPNGLGGFTPPNAVGLSSISSNAILSETNPGFPDNEIFRARTGFSYFQYSNSIPNLMRIFLHEIAHTLSNHPHTSLENTVHGPYYTPFRDWSMMDYGRSSSLANAWERWFSGWIDITHDLSSEADNGTYFIGDYMETDQTMRLKIPHTQRQFLWLTFRSDTDNPFYTRTRPDSDVTRPPNTPPNEIPLPISNNGLYGLFERISPSRQITSGLVRDGANGTRIMDGKGNHDFNLVEIIREPNPVLLGLQQGNENAFGMLASSVISKFDINDDDVILTIPTFNANGNPNEIGRVQEINNIPVFGGETTDVDIPNGRYSAFTNPPISNFLIFDDHELNNERANSDFPNFFGTEIGQADDIETLTPTILHSLSFDYRRIGNQARIIVDYDDGRIRNDFRMTGNVLLPAEEDIILNRNRTLTVNRSGTNNRETPSPAGDFINETVFKIADGGSFRAAVRSTVILDEGSTTIFEENSELIMAAASRIIIRGGALLCIKTTDVTISASNAQIIVEDGFLNVSSGIDISAYVVNDNPFSFPTVEDNIIFCTPSPDPQHLHSIDLTTTGRDVCAGNDVVITPGQSLQLTSQRLILMEPGFEAQAGSSYLAEIRPVIPQDCDIEFIFELSIPPTPFNGGFNRTIIDNENNIAELDMSIYPNPSSDIFNVEIKDTGGSFNYQIKNMDGITLKEGKASGNNFSINTSGIRQGIYILIVSNGKQVSTQQIVKL